MIAGQPPRRRSRYKIGAHRFEIPERPGDAMRLRRSFSGALPRTSSASISAPPIARS